MLLTIRIDRKILLIMKGIEFIIFLLSLQENSRRRQIYKTALASHIKTLNIDVINCYLYNLAHILIIVSTTP